MTKHRTGPLPIVLPSLLGIALLVNPTGAQLEPTEPEPKTEAIKSGTVLWEFETAGAVYSSPAIGTDGTVYIASATSGRGRPTIFALDGKTGVKRWEVAKSGIVAKNSIAIGKGGVVYLTTISQVLSFDGQTGKAGWSRAGVGDTTPTFGADGTLYTVSGRAGRYVYALDVTKLKKGRLASSSQVNKWSSNVSGTFFIGAGMLYKVSSLPVIGSDGTLFIGGESGKVFALDGKTGGKKWEFDSGGPIWSSAAIGSDGTVYIGSAATIKKDENRNGIDGERGKVYALNPATGEKKWEFVTGGPVASSAAIGMDGTVYVGSDDKKVYALDGKNGTKKWEFETGGWVHSSPAIGVDGTVYVGSWDKKVYALDGNNGAKKWEFVTGGRVLSSPAIDPEGTLYIGSSDRKIYAIQTSSQGLAKSPWPMRLQNPQHTGRTVAVLPPEGGGLDQGGKAPKVVVGFKQLEERDGLWYLKGKPFTGVVVWKSDNGRKKWERTFKEGKRDGLQTSWYDNGQKKWEGTFKDGEKISGKRWDEDGNPQ